MNEMVERVYQFIEHKGISAYEFSNNCGLSRGYLVTLKKKSSSIGGDKINDILEAYPEMSALWLVTGKGSMLKDYDTIQQINLLKEPEARYGNNKECMEALEMCKSNIEDLRYTIISQKEQITLLKNEISRISS